MKKVLFWKPLTSESGWGADEDKKNRYTQVKQGLTVLTGSYQANDANKHSAVSLTGQKFFHFTLYCEKCQDERVTLCLA